MLLFVFIFFSISFFSLSTSTATTMTTADECSRELNTWNPLGPLVRCDFLDQAWIDCAAPIDASASSTTNGNHSQYNGTCTRWGGSKHEPLLFTHVNCTVLPCIECRGPREFLRSVPCIRYSGHYFLATLLYSMFLGVLAVDRFCLGYSAIAVGKLMTLGGLGVWWIVDVFLLVSDSLGPADGSLWMPYY